MGATLAKDGVNPTIGERVVDGENLADGRWARQVAKYIAGTPEATRITANPVNRFPDRFLFGTDEAALSDQSRYVKVFDQHAALWALLDPETGRKARLGNCERIFNEARHKLHERESAHATAAASQ